jgi:hypothetical protein
MVYKLSLADITTNTFRKFGVTMPCIRENRVFTFFSHEHFDQETRSKMLQAAMYVAIYKESESCVCGMKTIADYSGVLVSPLFLYHLRSNSYGRR